MKIDIVTIFPEMLEGVFNLSILKRAADKKLVEINTHDLRQFTNDRRGTVDDRPFGGGAGMVMMVEPLVKAIEKLKLSHLSITEKVILTTPRGQVWQQTLAKQYTKLDHLIIICGHYEGVDERIKGWVDEEISLGDFVMTGGEIAAMAISDSIVRLLPGVLAKEGATENESFSLAKEDNQILLEYPQYTQPREFRGLLVPETLLSGNHRQIVKWKLEQAKQITQERRPDLGTGD